MLHGREVEQAALVRLLEAARGGAGGAMLVRGEPGIGKTALLADARSQAAGMRVLSTVGVEAEAELAYAALHELLRPLLSRVARLPAPQAQALRVAFGLRHGPTPNRFLVSLAALTLLSESATQQPVLCLVDDAHWADTPSRAALGFVARRLAAEPVALVLAARDGVGNQDQADTVGTAELRLDGLAPTAAAALLAERWDDRLDPVVRQRVLEACAGNPLALIELPSLLTAEQRAGREALDDPLPLTGALEQAFLRRVRAVPDPDARRLLLLVAAEGTGRLEVVRAAAEHLGLDAAPLEANAFADLVRYEKVAYPVVASMSYHRLRFTHPLVRSVIYHNAGASARREAHRALAAALSTEEVERRAWHRARADDSLDEGAAAELEASAQRTVQRSGYAAAATALEWSARLTPASEDCARRLVAAADAAWRAGASTRARTLLDRAGSHEPQEIGVRLDLQLLRGWIEMCAGDPTLGARTLVGAATQAAELDRARATFLLIAAAYAVLAVGQWTRLTELRQLATDLLRDTDGDPRPSPSVLILRLLDTVGHGVDLSSDPARRSAETAAASGALAGVEHLDDPMLLGVAGALAWGTGAGDLAYRLLVKAVARARELGAAGTLAWALGNLCIEETHRGRIAAAEAHALQGRQLAQEAGHVNIACRHMNHLARIAVLRGRQREARELAGEVLAEATQRRLVGHTANAHYTLGLLALDTGSLEEALRHLGGIRGSGPLPGQGEITPVVTPELVEAAVRAGEPDRFSDRIASSVAWAMPSRSAAVPAIVARCRALTAPPDEADRHFQQALQLHELVTNRPIEHARTELLYGEFLRRQRRRGQARTHLRNALGVFDRLGLLLLAERARRELRAAGETARRRDPSTLDALTPQELQIATAVAEGASNREVAARLFITPRTVAHHLHNVFAKLGISSRAELVYLASRHDILNRAAQAPGDNADHGPTDADDQPPERPADRPMDDQVEAELPR